MARAAADPIVDEAISEITRIWTTGLRETVLQVGAYMIRTFYGSVEAARSLSPAKPSSLRALIERAAELPLSAHALKVAVAVTVQARSLPRPVARALSASQHEKLLVVRDAALRARLATEAVSERLTVRELEARVRQVQPPRAGGRKPRHPLERGLAAAVRALAAQSIADGLSASGMRSLTREQARTLDIEARRARELLEQIADALARRLRA